MVKHLSEKDKEKILYKVTVRKQSVSSVAKKYDSSAQTIYNIINGRTKAGPNKRQSSISDETKEKIIRLSRENPSASSPKIREMLLPAKVSTSLINKLLAQSGLVCSSRKAPLRHTKLVEVKEEEDNGLFGDNTSEDDDTPYSINSVLYMGRICNPQLTIGRI